MRGRLRGGALLASRREGAHVSKSFVLGQRGVWGGCGEASVAVFVAAGECVVATAQGATTFF